MRFVSFLSRAGRAVLLLGLVWLVITVIIGCACKRSEDAERLTYEAIGPEWMEYSISLHARGEIDDDELASRQALHDVWRRDVYDGNND